MYILDSNIFIDAYRRYYGMDICPGFWDWLDAAIEKKLIFSINPVYKELIVGNDILVDWVKARKDSGFFISEDDMNTQQEFVKIAAYVNAGIYKDHVKAHFLGKADPWLIAKAKALNATLITHEVPAPQNTIKRVPIPNICDAFGVRYMNTFDLLRMSSASFSLK